LQRKRSLDGAELVDQLREAVESFARSIELGDGLGFGFAKLRRLVEMTNDLLELLDLARFRGLGLRELVDFRNQRLTGFVVEQCDGRDGFAEQAQLVGGLL